MTGEFVSRPDPRILLSKINQLETEHARLKAQLEARVATLEEQNEKLLAWNFDMREAWRLHNDWIVQQFAQVTDMLYPLFNKEFPSFAPTISQLERIISPAWTDPRIDRKHTEKKD